MDEKKGTILMTFFLSFPLSLLSDMNSYIIYNIIYISLFSLRKRLLNIKNSVFFCSYFRMLLCNTTSPNIGRRMHGPSHPPQILGVPSPSLPRSPPMHGPTFM